MKNKNILIVLPRYHTNYFHTVEALKKMGHNVNLFVYNRSKIENYSNIKPLKIKQSKFSIFLSKIFKNSNKMNKYYFPRFSSLKKNINKFNPDIVLIRSVNKIYLIMFILLRIKKKFKIFVYLQTSFKNLNNTNMFKKLIIYLTHNYLNIKYYSPIFEKKINKKNFFYLPFVAKIRRSSKHNKYNFLNIGKFIKKKNHLYFIKAVEKLSKTYPIKSLIIGEVTNKDHRYYYYKIKEYIKKRKLQKIVKIKINLKPTSMSKYYRLYSNYIHTASDDPAPISIIEALSSNNKVLCTHSCGTKNYIKKNLNGKIILDKNLDNLHKFMEKMILLNDNDKKKSKQNLEYLNNNISYENFNFYFNLMINSN